MKTQESRSPRRVHRPVAAAALTGAVALGVAMLPVGPQTAGATGAAGSRTSAATNAAALRAQAQEIASQVAADGQQVDQLDAEYEAATIRYAQLNSQRRSLQKTMAQTDAAITSSLHTLKEQALLAYVSGGGPEWTFKSGKASQDPSLTEGYADVEAQMEKAAEHTYKTSLAAQTKEEKSLAANAKSAAITVSDLRSSKAQAEATLASRQQSLSQVKGQLVAVYAQVQAENEARQQAAERAVLTAEGQRLPGASPNASARNAPARTAPARTATARNAAAGNPPAESTTTKGAPAATAPPTAPTTASRVAAPPRTTSPITARHVTATTRPETVATRPRPTTTEPRPVTTSPPRTTSSGPPAQLPGISRVMAYAEAQLGKPYAWAGAGPKSFDCSGLVMRAWEQDGVYFPHFAQSQYDETARISFSQLEPGDLVFFSDTDSTSNVSHVGIYYGNGTMIDAPTTGQNVSIQSIYWSSPALVAAGRVR